MLGRGAPTSAAQEDSVMRAMCERRNSRWASAIFIVVANLHSGSSWTVPWPARTSQSIIRGGLIMSHRHEKACGQRVGMSAADPRPGQRLMTGQGIPSDTGVADRPPLLTRANWLCLAAAGPVLALSAQLDSAGAAPLDGPVTVLGAGGKTGRECVEYLLETGTAVRAVARSLTNKEGQPLVFGRDAGVTLQTADVTVPTSLPGVIKGSSAVIFASSASKQGGSAKAVDYEGVINVAKACLEAKVPRLVVVSSGGVATPESAVYKFLNIFGEIMMWKIRGEDELRALYKAQGPGAPCHYTIVRPGGLTLDPPRGVSAVELNRGDTKSGRIARSDVARVCVEAVRSKKAEDCTFECYYKDTAKPLEAVGLSNILKQKTEEGAKKIGTESTGDTWTALFESVVRDADMV